APQAEAVENFRDDAADALAGLRLTVDEAAEQDVVLQRRGGVVARLVIELDGATQFGRQALGKRTPRRQQPLFHGLVDEIEAVARLDVRERQRDQLGAVIGAEGGQVDLLDARQQGSEIREIIGADERELLEERVPRRQVGEQLD